MNLNDAFPSTSLKAADLEETGEMTLTIKKVEQRNIGQEGAQEVKLVLSFEEIEKNLVTNKTNAATIAAMYGDKNIDVVWVGKKITLRTEMTTFQGKATPGIRVKQVDEKEVARKAFWDYANDVLFLTPEEGRGILKENGGDYVKALAVMRGEQPEHKPVDPNAALAATDRHQS